MLSPKVWKIYFTLLVLLISFICFKDARKRQPIDIPVSGNIITLVTAWYPDPELVERHGLLYNSKHAGEIYHIWMRNFLSNIATATVIYCPPDMALTLSTYRNGSLPTKFVSTYASVWDIPPISPLRISFNTTQRALDLASADPVSHTPHEYGIWNAKPFLLGEVANTNPFNSRYFFWHDIGAMRVVGDKFKNWPDPERVHDVLERATHSDTVLLNVIGKQPCYIHGGRLVLEPPEVSFTINAAFFGGTKAAVNWLCDSYYDLVDYYLSKGAFVGREERNLHALAYLAPKRFTAIPSWIHERVKITGDVWQNYVSFYRNFLARREEMWDSMRLIPHAPLFLNVPFDKSCTPDATLYQRLQHFFQVLWVQLENSWSEMMYLIDKFLQPQFQRLAAPWKTITDV